MYRLLAFEIVLLCSGVARVAAQQVADEPSGPRTDAVATNSDSSVLILHPLRCAQPQHIGEALKSVFRGDSRIKSVELSPGGVLCVRARSEARQDVLEFLQVFDRPPRGVDVQVLLLTSTTDSTGLPAADSLSGPVGKVLETIAKLNADKRLAIVDRVEMPALEHQKTSALLYYTAPVVTGSFLIPSGDEIPRLVLVTPGATVHVIAEVSTDGTILLDLEVKAEEITDAVRSRAGGPGLSKATLKKRLQLVDGHATAFTVAFDEGGNSSRPAILVVAAKVHDESE